MNEKTRQLVLDLMAKAHAGAQGAVREGFEGLSPASRDTAERFLGEFRACLRQDVEGALRPAEVQERLASLVHGPSDPAVVAVLRGYAEAFQLLLAASRDGLRGKGRGH